MAEMQRIGELARDLNVPIETIRYYEREGLLPAPTRSEGNYRLYSPEQRQRLEFILHCRALDMSHQEIRELLRIKDAPEEGCLEVSALLDAHICHVTERVRNLRRLESDLKALRARCTDPAAAKDCQILHELALPERTRKPGLGAGHSVRRTHG